MNTDQLANAQPWENACIRLAAHVGDLIRALGEHAHDRPDRVRASLYAVFHAGTRASGCAALHLIPTHIRETPDHQGPGF